MLLKVVTPNWIDHGINFGKKVSFLCYYVFNFPVEFASKLIDDVTINALIYLWVRIIFFKPRTLINRVSFSDSLSNSGESTFK